MLKDRPKFLENPNSIQRPSSSLRSYAIETFPFEPVFGEIELAILDENGDETYPRVTQYLEYDARKGAFRDFSGSESEENVGCIRVSLGDGGMDNFKTSLLPDLEKQGYKIMSADLAITTFHRRDDGGSGTMGGDYMSMGVVLSKWSIWTQVGNGTEEQRQQLADWFGKVKEQQAK